MIKTKIETEYFFESKLIERLKVKLLFISFEQRQIIKNQNQLENNKQEGSFQ